LTDRLYKHGVVIGSERLFFMRCRRRKQVVWFEPVPERLNFGCSGDDLAEHSRKKRSVYGRLRKFSDETQVSVSNSC
jgi:hypothetical protein